MGCRKSHSSNEVVTACLRNTISETVLLTAVVIQVISGLKLFVVNRKEVSTFFEKLHIYSGLYLALFFVIHLGAVFTGRYILNLDTNFYFGVAGLNTFPYSLFFAPYYGLAILAFFGHVASIHHKKMKHSLLLLTPKTQSVLILLIGSILTLTLFYGLTNRFNVVVIPKEYGILVGK
ncbi:hypothetical protein [Solitalea longa]|uniref:hypothetical protein n=1 Tax=Solitalea longa TaxID=2079460 RepID=UPI001A9C7ADF|nr:hypothetical protein [Solitalea longa]